MYNKIRIILILKEAIMTKYGKLIYEIIEKSHTHLSAEEIFLELKKQEPKVVLATIYNNLNSLCKENIIRKLSVEGSVDKYDVTTKHDHLVCSKCGKLLDMTFEDITSTLEKQLGCKIESYDLKVFYTCKDCK